MQEFPPRLELLVTNRQRFQFELQGFNHVIMIVLRPDEKSIVFQCFLNQLQIYQITHDGKPGDTVTIEFPAEVLQKIRTATASKGSEPAVIPVTAAPPKKTEKQAVTATPTSPDDAPSEVKKDSSSSSSSSSSRPPRNPESSTSTTTSNNNNNNNNNRRANSSSSSTRKSENPDGKIGRTLTEDQDVVIPWISKQKVDPNAADEREKARRNGQSQTRAYRDAVNNNFYPLSRDFRDDPLHIWSFHLTLSNMAVSILPIDTHIEKYSDPSVFRTRIYRQLYQMKHYEELLYKHLQENPTEEIKTSPIPDQTGAVTLQAFSRSPLKKLLRVGIPANTPLPLLRLLNDCKSYANHLGINLLVDRIKY